MPAEIPGDADGVPVPRLRALDFRWVEVGGEPRLWLRDPLELAGAGQAVLLPEPLVPLLGACDGTRDSAALAREFSHRTGVHLPRHVVEGLVDTLDRALLLESRRYREAMAGEVGRYRDQPYRPPALAGSSYPADPDRLDALLESFAASWATESAEVSIEEATVESLRGGVGPRAVPPLGPDGVVTGVLSPHIDYARGGSAYAATWGPALPAVGRAEVVVVFGTDHSGAAGRLTTSRLPYATPWGALPLDLPAVDALAGALGDEAAFGEELHHRREHAIELAVVWLHWALRRAGWSGTVGTGPAGTGPASRLEGPAGAGLPAVVPVLCGSFHPYVRRPCPLPEADPALGRALDALARAVEGRRVLVVSAADLAHVGPAFGDPAPLGDGDKLALARGDARLLGPVAAGSAGDFLEALREGADRTRVCGLPPTYWALRLLERLAGGPLRGCVTAYRQCPADDGFGSVVSIAGAVWGPPATTGPGARAVWGPPAGDAPVTGSGGGRGA